MTKIVLAGADSHYDGSEGYPPLGLAYVASYLRKYAGISEIAIAEKDDDLLGSIVRQRPDIVGIGSTSVLFGSATNLAAQIKEKLDIPVIVGGPHVTCIPTTLPKAFDVGVVGEGERTMLELIQAFEKDGGLKKESLRKINGLTFFDGGKLTVTPKRELIEPLDSIPYPARDLFLMEKHYMKPRRIISKVNLNRGTHMLSSRGCPFNCVFCASSCFWRHKIRFFSPEYVIGEMKELIGKYNVEVIALFDDLFIANKDRLEKIVGLIKKEGIEKSIAFRCLARADMTDEKTCQLLKDMNVHTVSVGFESGSEKMLKYLKRNTVTLEQNVRAAKLLKQYGFEIDGLFMLGSPYETRVDMMKTLDFIKSSDIDTIELCFTTPFPGTDLWEYAKERGLVSDDMDWSLLDLKSYATDFNKMIFLNDQMSKEEFLQVYEIFQKDVERRNLSINLKLKDLISFNMLKRAVAYPNLIPKFMYFAMMKKIKLAKENLKK